MFDRRTGTIHDHDRKDRVNHSEILLPIGAPKWALDSSSLWNDLEANERRCDAQLAREATVAIPHELPYAAGIALVRRFSKSQFASHGYPVEVSVHGFEGSSDGPRNWHAHIMAAERTLGPSGWGRIKDRSRNRLAQVYTWREAWADHANAALHEIGSDVRINHRRTEDIAFSSEVGGGLPALASKPHGSTMIAPIERLPVTAHSRNAWLNSRGWMHR